MHILAETNTDEGVGKIALSCSPSERGRLFEKILVGHARGLFDETGQRAGMCFVSGMAPSNLGWVEIPYARAPLPVRAECLVTQRLSIEVPNHGPLQTVLISGVRTDRDLMRGEETEVLGLSDLLPEIARATSACLLLPGTHSKHVWLEQGVLARFSTHMTGELYSHLRSMPTLSRALSDENAFSEEEFLAGVDQAHTGGFLASLFQIRTRMILSPGDRPNGASFLSGMLIGAELAHVSATTANLYLGGTPRLLARYASAASRCGIGLQVIPAEVIGQAVVRAHALFFENFSSSPR